MKVSQQELERHLVQKTVQNGLETFLDWIDQLSESDKADDIGQIVNTIFLMGARCHQMCDAGKIDFINFFVILGQAPPVVRAKMAEKMSKDFMDDLELTD